MTMHNPPHPGEIIGKLCLEPIGVSTEEAAEALGVGQAVLYELLQGNTRLDAEMAVRLSIAFETSAESWLNQQLQYDLWHAEQHRHTFKVKELVTR